ncbi:unnamed protein product, partial [Polarella glacialis]
MPPAMTSGVQELDARLSVLLDFGPDVKIHAFSQEVRRNTGNGKASASVLDSTGTFPWYGGLLLASWIATLEPPEVCQGRSVIELGCGSAAFPSAAISMRGAAVTRATDGCAHSVRSAGAVLAYNDASVGSTARYFAWQDGVAEDEVRSWDI